MLTLLTEHILPHFTLSGAPDGVEAAHSLGARGPRSGCPTSSLARRPFVLQTSPSLCPDKPAGGVVLCC